MLACRLLLDEPDSGPWNMAVDEVLLAAAEEQGATSLRFYTWTPATLSLGYFQKLEDRHCHPASLSCPVVRRASGGGAIVHDAELTYSFAAPTPDRASQQLRELYQTFHQSLIETLADFQVKAVRYGMAHRKDPTPFLCFLRRSPEDLVVSEKKVVGSAQRRGRGAVLQHGSILLSISPSAPELPGINQLADVALDARTLADAWSRRLAQRLDLQYIPFPFTDHEQDQAETYLASHYDNPQWTHRM